MVSLNLNIVEMYVKNLNNIDLENIMSLQLSLFKSYLKILEVPYFLENTNLLITSNVVKEVIKKSHIFNDVFLALHPQIIKTSSKSDITVIWINIWDSQNNLKAKDLINKCFNIGCQIAIIRMNSDIPQCKNYWKWGHTTFACCSYNSKCQKCNGSHKVKHYRDIVWYCKANFKINPSKLKIKKGESCSYLFKCINCKGEHQVITIIQELLPISTLDWSNYVFHSEKHS